MNFVDETTDKLENHEDTGVLPAGVLPQQIQFKPKIDMSLDDKIKDEIIKVWDTIRHTGDFERFLDIILAALERREDDYMSLIKGMDKKELNAYAKIYSILSNYFLDGNYGDPLGSFYEENFSYGRNGEFYTPFNVAHMMAKMINPEPEEIMCDPCCGSGRMFLAVRCVIHENHGWFASSRYGRNVYGMDISSRAVKMAKINMYLTDYVYMICLMNEVVWEMMKKGDEECQHSLIVKR